MKLSSRTLSIIVVICLVITAIPASVLAASEEEYGQIFTTSNGDGYTPYNLQWDNAETGIVSFDLQRPVSAYWSDMVSTGFTVRVFRNGEPVGISAGISATENSNVTHGISDISEYMTEPGTYFFTVYFVDGYSSIKSSWGEISKSTEYVKGQGNATALDEDISEVPNGDGYTPFNLKWLQNGQVSFEKQAGRMEHYRLEVYRNGVSLQGMTVGNRQTIEVVDLSEYLAENGEYYFTVYACKMPPSMDIDGGQIAQSSVYRHGDASGSPADPIAGVSTPEPDPIAPNINSVMASTTNSSVLIDGVNVTFDAYNINGSNYFKLRDLAYALNDTSAQFDVGWDGSRNAINLLTGQSYSGEKDMQESGSGQKAAVPTASQIYVDGDEVTLTAYNIEGNNYFMLRELGDILGFDVDWDGGSNSIMISTDGSGEISYEDTNTYTDTTVGGEFSAAQYIDAINQHLTANGYGKMIVDEALSQFAQKQVDLYTSKYDVVGSVFAEGDNVGYMPIMGHSVPKGVSPMSRFQEFSLEQLNNLHLLDENDFYVGIGYGEMSEFNIIHIIAYTPYR